MNHNIKSIDIILKNLVIAGDWYTFQHLVDKGEDIHTDNDFALRHSIEKNDLYRVTHLVGRGANYRINGDSLIIRSVELEYWDILKYLLGLDTYYDYIYEQALKTIAYKGNLDMVKYFIENEYHLKFKIEYVEKDKYFEEVLSSAAFGGHIDIVKYLVHEIKYSPKMLEKAVHNAGLDNHWDIVVFLADNGADFTGCHSLFIYAASAGRLDMFHYLISKGAKLINPQHRFGSNLLILNAAGGGHLNVVKYLVENNINSHEDCCHALLHAKCRKKYNVPCHEVINYLEKKRI